MTQPSIVTPEILLKQAIDLGEKGNLDTAADMMVLAAKDQTFDFLMQVASALENIKRFGKARKIYRQAINIEPDNYLTYARLGLLFTDVEKFPRAIRNLKKAIELNPGMGDLYYDLGLVYQSAGDTDQAISFLEKALVKGATSYLVYGDLARIYEGANQMEKLEEVVRWGLKESPNDPFLNFNAAVMERRQGNFEAALERLHGALNPETLKRQGATPQDIEDAKFLVDFELAQNYDILGNYEKAFQYFTKANMAAARVPLKYSPNKDHALANIASFMEMDFSTWQKKTADRLDNPDLTPAFLVGFPRSGTTLLHQILNVHTNLEVLEEPPVLAALSEDISRQLGSFPASLKDADTAQLNQFRDGYLKGVGILQTKPGVVRFIDKLPLNINIVPLIIKLFPDAKFILALRHPCDCTLSCFMQNFKLNHSMMNFFNLDDATYFYEQTFSLWQKYVQEMDLDVHIIRYEDVVTDLEKEARSVISYLGLDWQSRILKYRDQAKEKKRMRTPSYHQVVKPIYQDAKGRWRHYQKHLEPFLPRLNPYIDEFGYGDQD